MRRGRRGGRRRRRRRRGGPPRDRRTCTPRRAQRGEVLLHRRVLPHLGVHRRAHEHRRARREQRRGEQVVGDARPRTCRCSFGGRRARRRSRSALWPSRVCGIGSGPSNSDVRAGSDASAENVSAPTKRCASSVSTGATCTPASTSRRQTSTALYAAIPPQTPRTTAAAQLGARLAGIVGRLSRRRRPGQAAASAASASAIGGLGRVAPRSSGSSMRS